MPLPVNVNVFPSVSPPPKRDFLWFFFLFLILKMW